MSVSGRLFGGMLLWVGIGMMSTPGPEAAVAAESTRWVMGTALRVVRFDAGGEEDARRTDRLFEVAEQWDEWLSPYREDSLLSSLHRHPGQRRPVPAPVRDYFERSRRDHDRTGGLFDILHTSSNPARAWEGLDFSPSGSSPWVRLEVGVVVDPGGNGKGVALAAMVDSLRAWGERRALLDFGGSSWYAVGRPQESPEWRIDLEDPRGRVLGTVRWHDAALSISQTRLRAAENGGGAAHIVDPRNGRLVVGERTAVVLSPDAVDAEVLSTALLVAGTAGLSLVDHYPGATAVILDAEGVHRSSGAGTRWFLPASPRSP